MKIQTVTVEFESESIMTDEDLYVPVYTAVYRISSGKLDDGPEIDLVSIVDELGRQISPSFFKNSELDEIESNAWDEFSLGRARVERL